MSGVTHRVIIHKKIYMYVYIYALLPPNVQIQCILSRALQHLSNPPLAFPRRHNWYMVW